MFKSSPIPFGDPNKKPYETFQDNTILSQMITSHKSSIKNICIYFITQ